MSSEERILLVRLSHLGDVVHALPVFHALRGAHPRARIGWAVQRDRVDLAPVQRFLSGASDSPADRFSRHTEGPYVLVDGTVIASDWDDLIDGQLSSLGHRRQ